MLLLLIVFITNTFSHYIAGKWEIDDQVETVYLRWNVDIVQSKLENKSCFYFRYWYVASTVKFGPVYIYANRRRYKPCRPNNDVLPNPPWSGSLLCELLGIRRVVTLHWWTKELSIATKKLVILTYVIWHRPLFDAATYITDKHSICDHWGLPNEAVTIASTCMSLVAILPRAGRRTKRKSKWKYFWKDSPFKTSPL